jgi:hypothetical protein
MAAQEPIGTNASAHEQLSQPCPADATLKHRTRCDVFTRFQDGAEEIRQKFIGREPDRLGQLDRWLARNEADRGEIKRRGYQVGNRVAETVADAIDDVVAALRDMARAWDWPVYLRRPPEIPPAMGTYKAASRAIGDAREAFDELKAAERAEAAPNGTILPAVLAELDRIITGIPQQAKDILPQLQEFPTSVNGIHKRVWRLRKEYGRKIKKRKGRGYYREDLLPN